MWRAILMPFLGGGNPGAPVLPRRGTTGTALVIVMTIMSYLACLAVWAGISITTATQAWTSGISNTVTVQIKPPEDEPVPQRRPAEQPLVDQPARERIPHHLVYPVGGRLAEEVCVIALVKAERGHQVGAGDKPPRRISGSLQHLRKQRRPLR